MRFLLLLCLLAHAALPATKVLVTVTERKSGKPVTGLKAEDFVVLEDKTPRQVESAEFQKPLLDVMLLLDTSLAGPMVAPVSESLIGQLEPKEQMAVVSFHSSADLIQDFTSSKELLMRSLGTVKFGNTPRLLDALYAAIEDGFSNSSLRRTIVLLTAGVEGSSRVSERQVVRLARRNGVSIYPVYMIGSEKSMMENLARQTGGASFNLRDMKKSDAPPGSTVFQVLRAHYVLTLTGNLALGEKMKIEVNRPEKLFISGLPLE
ncbi:MAG: VWA domain-containing protein [Bryobacteraceae bacterium]